MIRLQLDLGSATSREIESFLALPNVGAALDILTHLDDPSFELRFREPEAAREARRDEDDVDRDA